MLLAVLSDIHANLEALEACLAVARAAGAERFVFLGDLVGYGADPRAVVDFVMRSVGEEAIAVLGNHDAAIATPDDGMHGMARAALEWTRQQLLPEQAAFLAGLPLTARQHDILFVHANAAAPGHWGYVDGVRAAEQSLRCVSDHVIVCGHIHVPAVYHQPPMKPVSAFAPVPGVAIPLSRLRRWLLVTGACGQPRDNNPAACMSMLDTAGGTLTTFRVPYDVDRAARKIRAAGLPSFLADRLALGR